jgi:hypothetical protein
MDDGNLMSSLSYRREASPRARGASRHAVATLLTDHGSDILLGVVVAVFGIALLAEVPKDYSVDSWLALVDGRAVWQFGIPHHDLMNAINHGRAWTDEQWLSQLATYAIYRTGGLGLLGALNVALLLGPIGVGVAAARRRGAPFRSVLLSIPMCVALIAPSREIRTQEFVLPLFMATVCLLSADSRRPSRRVYWCLPILVLWANLHGSVTQGAGLVVLYAGTVLWQRRGLLRHRLSAWTRPLALAGGALAAIFITPYGLSMAAYYHSTLVNSTLRRFVSEWQPVTSNITTAIAFGLLAGLALVSFVRNPSRTTAWEKLALLVLAAGTFEVVRNAVFLGLLGLIVVPLSLAYGPSDAKAPAGDDAARSRSQVGAAMRMRVNGTLLALAAVGIVAATAATVSVSAATVQDARQNPRMAAVVARAVRADPSLKLIVADPYSDYLLWKDPGLAGHIAADLRFELLSGSQVDRLESALSAVGPDFRAGARGYRLLVLNRAADALGIRAYRSEPGSLVIFRDRDAVVILRSAHQARRA